MDDATVGMEVFQPAQMVPLKPPSVFQAAFAGLALFLAEAWPDLCIHPQNVLPNPLATKLMQFPDQFQAITFQIKLAFDALEASDKFPVGFLIGLLRGTPAMVHALFLIPEMGHNVRSQKINEFGQQPDFFHAGVGVGGPAVELVNIVNQHSMLGVNDVMAGLKFFGPNDHLLNRLII